MLILMTMTMKMKRMNTTNMKKGYAILDSKNKVKSLFSTEQDAKRVIERLFTYKSWTSCQLSLSLVLIHDDDTLLDILEYIDVF